MTVVTHHITTDLDYSVIAAIELNDIAKAAKLVNEEAVGINARDRFGTTTLMMSVLRKQLVLTGILLNAYPRVDVNAHTPSGYTALHYSIGDGSPGITRALLRRGADPNKRVSAAVLLT